MIEWKYLMWCLYIYSCVIYPVICITILLCHTHTYTPRMQWFRGSLLYVLVCAIDKLRSFCEFQSQAHIKGEPLINHWTQKLKCLYSFVSFNQVVINHKKGEIESASSPLVSFGWLNDNMIKSLTRFATCGQVIGYLTDI